MTADAASARRQAIQAVYKDTTLSGPEKHKKVQDIMKMPLESFAPKEEEKEEEFDLMMTIGEICGDFSLSDEDRNKQLQIALNKEKSQSVDDKKGIVMALFGEIPDGLDFEGDQDEKDTEQDNTKEEKEEEKTEERASPTADEQREDAAISRRRAIGAIFADKSLSAQERQRKMKEILNSPDSTFATSSLENEVAAVTPPEPAQEDPESAKRKAIAAVYRDSSLSAAEKHARVQTLMKGGQIETKKGEPKEEESKMEEEKADPEPPAEDPASAKRKAIAAVYRDSSLSAAEKHARVQAIMKGEQVETFRSEEEVTKAAPTRANPRTRPRLSATDRQVSVPVIPVNNQRLNQDGSEDDEEKEEEKEEEEKEEEEEEEEENDPDAEKRKAIQAIYRDSSLNAQQKNERVQEILGGSTLQSIMKRTSVALTSVPRVSAPVDEEDDESDDDRSYSDEDSQDSRSNRSDEDSRSYSSRSRSLSRSSRSYSSRSRSLSRSSRSYSSRSRSSGSRSSRSYSSRSYSSRSYSSRSDSDSEEGNRNGARPPLAGIVRATPDTDDDSLKGKKGSCCKRCCCCFLFFLIILGGAGGPFLYKYWDEVYAWSVPVLGEIGIDLPTNAPTFPPVPTSSPTSFSLYDPPSGQDCSDIAAGKTLSGQENQFSRWLDAGFDLLFDAEPADLDSIVTELEGKMQTNLAPALAGCSSSSDERRHLVRQEVMFGALRGTRRLLDKYAIRNVKINTSHEESLICQSQTEKCYLILARMNVWSEEEVGGSELLQVILSQINSALDDGDFDLSQGKVKFNGVGLTKATRSPTTAPSQQPVTLNPTSNPTAVTSASPSLSSTL